MENHALKLHTRFHLASFIINHSNGRHTPVCIQPYFEKHPSPYGFKTKKIYLKNIFFSGFLKKPLWVILLGSWMPSFIGVVRLQSYQNSGELSVGRRRKKAETREHP